MQVRLLGWLEDIRLAADDVIRISAALDLDAYIASEMERLAVERLLITLGEAMSQLAKEFPQQTSGIGEWREVINFRNILVHRYRTLDHVLIHGIIRNKLPSLRDQVARMIAEIDKH